MCFFLEKFYRGGLIALDSVLLTLGSNGAGSVYCRLQLLRVVGRYSKACGVSRPCCQCVADDRSSARKVRSVMYMSILMTSDNVDSLLKIIFVAWPNDSTSNKESSVVDSGLLVVGGAEACGSSLEVAVSL